MSLINRLASYYKVYDYEGIISLTNNSPVSHLLFRLGRAVGDGMSVSQPDQHHLTPSLSPKHSLGGEGITVSAITRLFVKGTIPDYCNHRH